MTLASLGWIAGAALLAGAAPVAAADPSVAPNASTQGVAQNLAQNASLATAAGVARYYDARGSAPIWFRPDGGGAASAQLLAILRRAPLDGLASGPLLAGQVEAAMARARSGNAAEVAQAERLLSQVWTLYVQTIRAPAPGMIYADPAVAADVPRAERILYDAARASSLVQHIHSIATVNPIYAQLRDTAWSEYQQSGAAPDARLLANLARARAFPASGRFLVVDLATSRLWMYEDGQLRDHMKVIVGKPTTQTPMIASTIHYATFNPYWNVPPDVVQRVVAPAVLKEGQKFLTSKRYEVVSDWTDLATVVPTDEVDWKAVADGRAEVRVRQLPGNGNMMGHYKFAFANQQGIYLHDTPNKGLFNEDQRTFSLGCVRVEDAKRLGRWLLGREPVAPSGQPELHVQLPSGVPIYLTYLTAHVDAGRLGYSKDVYNLDSMAQPQVASAVTP